MGIGLFKEVKGPGRGLDHTPTSSAEVKERVELYLYSLSRLSWLFSGKFYIKMPVHYNPYHEFLPCK
jgi:hypothetical protein